MSSNSKLVTVVISAAIKPGKMRVRVDISRHQRVQRDGNSNTVDGGQDEDAPGAERFKECDPGGNLQKKLEFGRQEIILRDTVQH